MPQQAAHQAEDPSGSSGGESVAFRARLAGVLFLSGIFFFNFLARFVWSPLLVSIEADLGIRHTQAGSLFLMVAGGYVAGLTLSGHLSARVSHQATVVISSLACAAALTASMLAPSLGALRLALVAIGLTTGLYLPSGIASLTYRLAPRDFSKAFSFHEMAPSLGFIAGPLLAEALLGTGTWRATLVPVAAGILVLGLLYARRPWTGGYRGEPLSLASIRSVAALSAFWCMVVPFMLGIAANVAVFSMLPLYLQTERGLDQTLVNYLLSASRVAAMLSPFATGWAAARFGARPVVSATLLVCGAATLLLGVLPTGWIWVPLFLQPPLSTAFFPPAFSILTRIVPAGRRNLIIALMMPMGMLVGAGVIPTVIGAFGDAGRFHTAFTLAGALTMASTLLLWRVRLPGNREADGL
jgi:NNP family nitrate/nitrite transporter-like MFS transporter